MTTVTHLHEVVPGDKAWMHFYEPQRQAQCKTWVPKGEKPPQIARRNECQKKVLDVTIFSLSGIKLQKPHDEKSIIRKYYSQSVLAQINCFTRVFDRTPACMVSNFCIITQVLTSASSCSSILRTRTLKLCLTLSTSLTSCLVTFSCSQT